MKVTVLLGTFGVTEVSGAVTIISANKPTAFARAVPAGTAVHFLNPNLKGPDRGVALVIRKLLETCCDIGNRIQFLGRLVQRRRDLDDSGPRVSHGPGDSFDIQRGERLVRHGPPAMVPEPAVEIAKLASNTRFTSVVAIAPEVNRNNRHLVSSLPAGSQTETAAVQVTGYHSRLEHHAFQHEADIVGIPDSP